MSEAPVAESVYVARSVRVTWPPRVDRAPASAPPGVLSSSVWVTLTATWESSSTATW